MPLVFVHGVNTRRTAEYDAEVRARDAMFRQYCLTAVAANPDATTILNPYWGDQAATFPWNYGFAHDSQPALQAFGAGGDALDDALRDAGVTGTSTRRNDVILTVARQRFQDAVDLLWTAAGTSSRLTQADADDLARISARVHEYAQAFASSPPPWLSTVTSDSQFVERLVDEAEKSEVTRAATLDPGLESFGSGGWLDRLKAGATRAAERAADAGFGGFVESKLPDVLRRFSCFFGDVFEYIKQRSSGTTEITAIVLADLMKAKEDCKNGGEALVCVGHSMGGDILYDLLTDTSLPDAPECDYFITVGSQVGLFEELKLFKSSVASFPPNPSTKVPASRHPRIKRWINVFDRSDPFGYPATTIFAGVQDFVFDTRASTLSAHGAYFLQPTFHERLRARIVQADT
jgi:hypothetical protein